MTQLHPNLNFTQITVRHPAGYEVILVRAPSAIPEAQPETQPEAQAATVHAYRNSCPHLGIGLDYGNGQCLLEDGKTLLCAMHGATFEADTGLCTGGPCAGSRLKRVAVTIVNGAVICD